MSPTAISAGADNVNADYFNGKMTIAVDGTNLSADQMTNVLSWECETMIGRPDFLELRLLQPMDQQGTSTAAPTNWKPGALLKLTFENEVLFDGEVTSVDFAGSVESSSAYTLLAYDKRHRLYRSETRKIFKDSKAADVISGLVGAAGLSTGTCSGLPETVHKYYLHLGTAGDYIDRLCDQYGLLCTWDTGKIVLKKAADYAEAPVTVSASDTLLDYRFRQTTSADVSKATVKSWDPKAKQAVVGTATRGSTTLPGGGVLEGVNSQSAFFETTILHTTLAPAQNDAEKEAQGLLARNVDAGIQFDGTCTMLPTLKAGKLLDVKGVPSNFAGKYRLTSVRHVFDLAEGGRTHVSSRGADDVSVTGLMSSAVAAAPGTAPMDDKLHGVFPAIVTKVASDPQSGAVGKDGAAGEVQVKMPWLDDTLESSWLRVVTVGGGKDRGLFVMPEVNDEVLVAFEFGDPRRGYVLGGLYNGKDASPLPGSDLGVSSGNVEQRIWKTRVGHKILLSDKSGEEHILISGKDGAHFMKIDVANKLISIEGQDYKLKTTGKVDVEATGAVKVKSSADVNIEGINVTIKASANLNLEGTAKSTLKGATVEVNSSGPATVKGNPIMLN